MGAKRGANCPLAARSVNPPSVQTGHEDTGDLVGGSTNGNRRRWDHIARIRSRAALKRSAAS